MKLQMKQLLDGGLMINSEFLNGLDNEKAKKEIIKKIRRRGHW